MYNLKNFEKETIINYSDDTNIADIYTCNASLIRSMDAKVKKYPEYFQKIKEDAVSKTYKCNKKYISIRSPKIMTDEQLKAARARMSNIRRVAQSID